MIRIQLNEANFEYDIYSLVKAFFPREEIVITCVDQLNTSDVTPQEDLSSCDVFCETKYEADKISFTYGNRATVCTKIDALDRRDTKNKLKKLIYEELSDITKKTLPWGTLTGIRPTKIALGMVDEKKTDEEIRNFMQTTYLTSEDKMNTSIQIARREADILSRFAYNQGYSIYIGIPFCPSICLYCSFSSYSLSIYQTKVDAYLDALEKEIIYTGSSLSSKPLHSIYIGGGTPTSLNAQQMDRLLSMIDKYLDTSHLLEITVEAGRPDSITRDKLEVIKAHGIDRISINPQSMNQKTLDLIGRHHSVEQIWDTYHLARDIGFRHINMDLIIGLPGETKEDIAYTLDQINDMKPDNLTVHSLAMKRSARLHTDWESYRNYHYQNSNELMEMAEKIAKNMDMNPYYLYRQKNMAGNLENVGYAKDGKEGIYNILIMEEKQTIMALGAGASCKYVTNAGKTVTRSENVKDVDLYIQRIDEMILRKQEKLEEIQWL